MHSNHAEAYAERTDAMVKWNEKQASQQMQNIKTAVIKLASLEKRTVKND